MKQHLIVSCLAIIVILASCKKDDNKSADTAGIQGNYKLKYLSAATNSTVTADDGEKTVTTSDYTTTNNQGTIVFDKTNLTYTGLSYSIATEAKYYLYQDNELIDSSTAPFNISLPASNGTSTYVLVGADSIYFPQGSATIGMGGSTAATPIGGRYSVNGALLTIVQRVAKVSTTEDSGVIITTNDTGLTSMVLEKQ